MGDSISTWLSSLFNNNQQAGSVNGLVPQTPGQAGVSLTGQSTNQFQTPGLLSQSPSALQYCQAGLCALQGLASLYLGFQNTGLAKQQAAQQQQNWDKQWNANVKSTNTSLADRQRARVASNPNAYESVDSYMKKYGIS